MKHDFDAEVNRRGTGSIKWEYAQSEEDPTRIAPTDRFFGDSRMLPLWVADMDFACPQPVVDAIIARAKHGIFGYTNTTDSYFEAVTGWIKRRHGWDIAGDWIVTAAGVVPALCALAQTYTRPGDKILVQTPVYYPFYLAIKSAGAETVRNPLINQGGRYTMDFDDLEAKASDPAVKLAILCNPHNPVGRAWTQDELARFGEICRRHQVMVIADEVHADLILKGHAFAPYIPAAGDVAGADSISCMSASKTFNLAGLKLSNIIIPDKERRAQFEETLHDNGHFGVDLFGAVALEAAYRHGEEWLAQLLDYLQGNHEFLRDYLATYLPQVILTPLEGTYLAWMDFRALGMRGETLKQLMINEARVYLDEGFIFGPEGDGFERINLACPRTILADALDRIRRAVEASR